LNIVSRNLEIKHRPKAKLLTRGTFPFGQPSALSEWQYAAPPVGLRCSARFSVQFRADAFNLFNRPNFGNPNLTATPGSTSFGIITSTRSPTGDAGSSRQIQLALKLVF
jgi:hypothetical protein